MTAPSEGLRELRQWHWRECEKSRHEQRVFEARLMKPISDTGYVFCTGQVQLYKADADFHLRAVQELNEFFAIDDHVGLNIYYEKVRK